jgi:hypothetical protein
MHVMKKLVDVEVLSEKTGIAVRTLRTFAATKKITSYQFGFRTYRFDPEEVAQELEGYRVLAITAGKTKKGGGK